MQKTKMQKLKNYLSEHPGANDAELADIADLEPVSVRVYLSRLRHSGQIMMTTDTDGKRQIITNFTEPATYKREVLQMLCDKYLEDFDAAELFSERVEIGKLIIRILEKL